MNYNSVLINDKNNINSGFDGIWFFNRSYLTSLKYSIYINDENSQSINEYITKEVVYKFDDNNILTLNKFPYSIPPNSTHYIYWTFNDANHLDVFNNLNKIRFLENMEYLIWINPEKDRSVKHIKHFHIIIRPKIIIKNISSKLNKLIILARHGPREPNLLPPKFKQFNKSNKSAQLTEHGQQYCINFGKYIFNLFSPYFEFNENKTCILSSDFDRTKDSAKYIYYGIFNKILDKKDIIIKDVLNDIKILNNPIFENILDDIDLETSSIELDEQLFDITGYKIKTVNDYLALYNTIEIYKEHNKELPLNLTEDLIDKLKIVAHEYYYKLLNNSTFCHKYSSQILKLIMDILSNNDINFIYMSSHDFKVYSLGYMFAKEILKLIYFCSSIRIEIWTYDIRIYNDDILLKSYYI